MHVYKYICTVKAHKNYFYFVKNLGILLFSPDMLHLNFRLWFFKQHWLFLATWLLLRTCITIDTLPYISDFLVRNNYWIPLKLCHISFNNFLRVLNCSTDFHFVTWSMTNYLFGWTLLDFTIYLSHLLLHSSHFSSKKTNSFERLS